MITGQTGVAKGALGACVPETLPDSGGRITPAPGSGEGGAGSSSTSA